MAKKVFEGLKPAKKLLTPAEKKQATLTSEQLQRFIFIDHCDMAMDFIRKNCIMTGFALSKKNIKPMDLLLKAIEYIEKASALAGKVEYKLEATTPDHNDHSVFKVGPK